MGPIHSSLIKLLQEDFLAVIGIPRIYDRVLNLNKSEYSTRSKSQGVGVKILILGGPKSSKLEEMAIFRTAFSTGLKLVLLKFFRVFTWIT